jgi:hypothetical protein
MPSSKFLVQIDGDAFEELRLHSTLPYFLTDASLKDSTPPEGRKIIPINDDDAHVKYHLICRNEKAYLLGKH